MKRPALPCVVLAVAACTGPVGDTLPGYAEGDYVRIAAPATGTLARVYLKAGDPAPAGAPAFVLEQDAEQAGRAEALARLQRAQAQLANARKGSRPAELDAIRAQLAQAGADHALAQADLARQRQLRAARFVAPASVDAAQAAVARDQARVAELRARLRVARLGAREDDIAAAVQEQNAAAAQLALANWKLDQTARRVPQAGVVVDVYYREGELVPAGSPVVILLPPANIKARFFVPEAKIGMLSRGQAVSLQCDGCGAPIPAHISFIAPQAQFTAPLIYSLENRARLVFMVEARPAPAQAVRLHPGQPLAVRLAAP
jgi:HlyD family secretion protein